mgnify:CR=1 FL=1
MIEKIKQKIKHRKWKLYLYYNSIHIKTIKIKENTAPTELTIPINVWFKKQLFANNKVGIIVRPVRIIKNDEKNAKKPEDVIEKMAIGKLNKFYKEVCLVEQEFIMDPSDSQKRAAWNAVQKELQMLERPSYKLIADHIDHVVRLVGIDHVGLGSDFDGIEVTPEGMEDISMMPKLFAELRARRYSESDLSKIASDNFFRILQ